MAISKEELDDNLQTYEEFRTQVDRDLNIPPKVPKVDIQKPKRVLRHLQHQYQIYPLLNQ
jgi:hypothetical protein